MTLSIKISGKSLGQKNVKTTTLLDTGAGEKFINQNFVQNQKIKTKDLEHHIEVFNVDRTPNKWRTNTKYTWLDLTINGCTWPHNLFVTGLGKQKIHLGYSWFKQNNPEIDWEKCTLTWRKEQDNSKLTPKPLVEEGTHQEDWKSHTINPIEELDNEEIGNAVLIPHIEEMKTKVWTNAKENMATELAIKENKKKAKLINEELVPDDLHEFLDVFDKNKANWFPESNVWDLLCPRPIGSELPKDRPEMTKDLASAYVLCLCTLVVPNLRRDKERS